MNRSRNPIRFAAAWTMASLAALHQVAAQGVASDNPEDSLPFAVIQQLAVSSPVESNGSAIQIALSHDGKRLLVRKLNHTVQVWDIPKNKLIRSWYNAAGAIFDVAFTIDDKQVLVATGIYGPGIRCLDVETGKAVEEIAFPALKVTALADNLIWAVGAKGSSELSISPPRANRVDHFDRELVPLSIDAHHKTCIARSQLTGQAGTQYSLLQLQPDAPPILQTGIPNLQGMSSADTMAELSVAVTKPRAACMIHGYQTSYAAYIVSKLRRIHLTRVGGGARFTLDAKNQPNSLAVSRDGRFLATGSEDGHIRVWEMLTKQFVGEFKGTGTEISSLVFSADGMRILAAATDPLPTNGESGRVSNPKPSGGVYVWDLSKLITGTESPPPQETAVEWNKARFKRAWSKLRETEPSKAIEGLRSLAAHREEAIPMVAGEISRAILAPKENEIQQLIQQLSDPDYAMRNNAYRRLVDLRDIILDDLKEELARKHPLEVRMQITRIMEQARGLRGANHPAGRQAMRALWFLDIVGSPSALEQIKRLERGHTNPEVRNAARLVRKSRFRDS